MEDVFDSIMEAIMDLKIIGPPSKVIYSPWVWLLLLLAFVGVCVIDVILKPKGNNDGNKRNIFLEI